MPVGCMPEKMTRLGLDGDDACRRVPIDQPQVRRRSNGCAINCRNPLLDGLGNETPWAMCITHSSLWSVTARNNPTQHVEVR